MAADGRLRRTVGLTPAQALHERLLREVLNRLRGLDLVLKGGSALAFVHGLGRHTTDLDFDGRVPVDIRDRMRRGAEAGVVLGPVKGRKRRKGHRFRAPYPNPFERRPTYLKVDLRLDPPPRARDVVTVGGIRTYKVEAIFEHKLRAMRSRIEGRDLFDVAFVMEHYGARLTDDHVRHAATLTRNSKSLERRYSVVFKRDEVLRELTTATETVLAFRRATQAQRRLRWPRVQEQRIPIPVGVLGHAIAIESRLRMDSAARLNSGGRQSRGRPDGLPPVRDMRRKEARKADTDHDWSLTR